MAKVDISTRTIQVHNFDFHYSADDFVNADDYESFVTGSRWPHEPRAYVIHTCGTVLAIVFDEYYAYCEQDALDSAADSGKLDSLQISEQDLADYETGEKSSEGYPEYEGIINLGNASEPFDSQNLEYFVIPAALFRQDETIQNVLFHVKSTASRQRINKFVDWFIASEFVQNWQAEKDSDFFNEPDRAARCSAAAESGADGKTHAEVIEDWREAFDCWLRDYKHKSSMHEQPERFKEAVNASFDLTEAFHYQAGTLHKQIG